jgi:hypothetical protein
MFFEEIRYLVIKTWHKCVCMRADVHTQVKVCLLLLLFFFFLHFYNWCVANSCVCVLCSFYITVLYVLSVI